MPKSKTKKASNQRGRPRKEAQDDTSTARRSSRPTKGLHSRFDQPEQVEPTTPSVVATEEDSPDQSDIESEESHVENVPVDNRPPQSQEPEAPGTSKTLPPALLQQINNVVAQYMSNKGTFPQQPLDQEEGFQPPPQRASAQLDSVDGQDQPQQRKNKKSKKSRRKRREHHSDSDDDDDQGKPDHKRRKSSGQSRRGSIKTTGNRNTSHLNPLIPFPNRLLTSDESEDSDLEEVEPPRAVRQSFGLLVGQTLSSKKLTDIMDDKFVEFNTLLPDATKEDHSLVLETTKTGHPKFKVENTKKFITLERWNEAFGIFTAAYTSNRASASETHNLILELLTYQRDVNGLARKNLAWWQYDRQFRIDKSNNPLLFSYGHLRHDLITCITIDRQPFREARAGRPFQQKDANRQRWSGNSGFQARDRSRSYSIPPGFCVRYNLPQQRCQAPPGKCAYKHSCPQCNNRHPIFLCKEIAKTTSNHSSNKDTSSNSH